MKVPKNREVTIDIPDQLPIDKEIEITIKLKDSAILQEWEKLVTFFKQKKTELLAQPKFKNKYVAICNEQVVDFDSDKFVLFDRTTKKYPNDIVLIVKVDEKERLVRLETPKVLK